MDQSLEPMRKKALPWYLLAIVVVILDQVTKLAVVAYLTYGERIEILPVFDLTLLYNTGAAFSMLSDAGGWQRWFFTGVALVMSVVLTIWLYRLPRNQVVLAAALSLVLGGAVGNVIDRMRLGHVVDFISVHYNGAYFPAFNVADSAITVGAALMLIDAFFFSGKTPKEQ